MWTFLVSQMVYEGWRKHVVWKELRIKVSQKQSVEKIKIFYRHEIQNINLTTLKQFEKIYH